MPKVTKKRAAPKKGARKTKKAVGRASRKRMSLRKAARASFHFGGDD